MCIHSITGILISTNDCKSIHLRYDHTALHPESVPLPWGYVSEETAIAFGDRIRAVEEYKKDTEPVPQVPS